MDDEGGGAARAESLVAREVVKRMFAVLDWP